MEPLRRRIPIGEIDTSRLPPDARVAGTDAFRDAVLMQLVLEYAQQGMAAIVTMDDREVTIEAFSAVSSALEDILDDLRAGKIRESIPKLESLSKGAPDDVAVLFNLGLAYSETGQLDEAIIRLKNAVRLDPTHAHAWTAIGVAYQRMGKPAQAISPLEKAASLAPEDGHALRNLGGLQLSQGRTTDAIATLKRALSYLPNDMHAKYGLAKALIDAGDTKDRSEADRLLREVATANPDTPLGDEARRALTSLAQDTMRSRVDGGLRPDVLMYMQGALELLAKCNPEQVKAIALEIATLGQAGLDINDPTTRYTLKTIPGDFSALRLVTVMYAAFRSIDPSIDVGIDFSREYTLAKTLAGSPPPRG
jgi:tetratricopeptide (TPR) repeat protein